ncbi:hypothetical protein J1N35_007346, partial [Gossypium stocksii]
MEDGVSDPIDTELDVEVAVTTDLELQPSLSENVNESIHFLAIVEEMSNKEINEF